MDTCKCTRDKECEYHRDRLYGTELTPIGEQFVIPGCEKHERPAEKQLRLWETSR